MTPEQTSSLRYSSEALSALPNGESARSPAILKWLSPAVALLVVGGATMRAQWAGWISFETAISLFILSVACSFVALAWAVERRVRRCDLSHRQTENHLREQVNRLALIIENEPECVKLVDHAGRLTEMNPAGLAMLEAESLAAARKTTLIEYILPEYQGAFIDLHRRVMRGEAGTLEFEIRGLRGTQRWLETHAVPLRDPEGSIQALLGITRDITARKLAARAQLQVQLFRKLIDRSNDLIYVADAESGRILDCNEALPRRLGYSRDEILSMDVPGFSSVAGASSWAQRMATAQASGSLLIDSTYRCKNGDALPVEINLSYVAHSPHALLVAVIRDVTDRRHQQARIDHLTRILRMQSAINSAVLRIPERDQMLQEACRVATEVGGYDHAVISLVDPDGSHARPKFRHGMRDIPEPGAFPIGDGTEADVSVTGRALRTGEVVVSNDVRNPDTSVLARGHLLRLGIRTVIALPFIVDSARVGALTLFSVRTDGVRDEELILLQDVAATLAFGLRSQRQADAAQFLAHYDSLTGLAKRGLFCDRLASFLTHRILPEDRPIVAAFDVRDLSGLNDTYGRSVGDALMQQVAERMKLAVESDHRIGYLGGGTFVIFATDLVDAEEGVVAAVDDAVFARPFEIDGRSFRLASRSGIARYPADGPDSAMLVDKAEAALRHAKESGEKSSQFTIRMHSDVASRLNLELRLREAIEREQFVLYYQPQVSISTGRVEAVEALLRWKDDEGVLIHPAAFLPVLESTGMIVTVGAWVLNRAAEDCKRWRASGWEPLRVAVNVSALQIRRRRFVDEVLKAIDGLTADGFGVDLEITESSVLQDLEDTSRKLRRLREAGVRIAIDDFGTGYSSLGLLPRLPADILKIDKTFVRGLPDNQASVALTSSIIRIASTFGLATVAEGVETLVQLDMLRTFHCDQSQGYLHARPMPVDELETRLRTWS
jgi:diguanylate cyclase (GGDEF)-like protein/PAS domain S-box-containing protein